MGKWQNIKLENVCRVVKGEQLNKLLLESSGDYPCINGGIEASGYTHKWNRPENTIAISEGGNSCGFVSLQKKKFWSGGHCYTLSDLSSRVEGGFLYYALKGRESLIMNLRVGSGLPNIQQTAIREFHFLLPEDKEEQKRISEILTTTDIAIAETEKLIAKYQRIKTGLMQDLLTKGIDAKGNIRSEQTHKFKTEKGVRVPEGWEVNPFKDLCQIIKDGTHLPPKRVENGVLLLGVSNIINGEWKLTKSDTQIPISFYNEMHKTWTIQVDDVLLAIVGDASP